MSDNSQQDAMIARLEKEMSERDAFIQGTIANAQDTERDLTESENELVTESRKRIERLDEQLEAVNAVLDEIGATELPIELVLNKIDAVDALGRRRLANRFPEALQVSAQTGEGLEELRARIADLFAHRFELVELLVPYSEGGKLAELYALGPPIESRTDREDGVLIRARLPERDVRRFARFLVSAA